MNAVHHNPHPALKTISIRCYAELNDFLPPERKQKDFTLPVKTPARVAEVIESIGIPLSEVDLVLVNNQPADPSHRVHHEDRLSIYPTFESFDISNLKTTHKEPLRTTRFILDAHLGKLAKYLRMLGFDTLYENDYGDDEIITIAREEKRIILSRDKALLKSPGIDHAYYVRATEKHRQLIEVVDKFDLCSQFRSFTRCMTCNSVLIPKNKKSVRDLIDPGVYGRFDEFFYCPQCRKVFWKGSHFERMERLVLDIIEKKVKYRPPDKAT